jgi:hypothetical protein
MVVVVVVVVVVVLVWLDDQLAPAGRQEQRQH